MNKKNQQQEPTLSFQTPPFLPIAGRVICAAAQKKNKKVVLNGKTTIEIIPERVNKDNYDLQRSNPCEGLDFIILSMTPDVNQNLRSNNQLPIINGIQIPLEVGDQVVVSANMQPITIVDGVERFFSWHYMDILGVIKNPMNMRNIFEKAKQEAKK